MDTRFPPTPQNTLPVAPPRTDEQRAALEAGHETTDVNVRGLFIFAGSLLVSLLVVFIGVALLFKGYGVMNRYLDTRRAQGEPGSSSIVRTQPDYQGPMLQNYPEQDLQQLRQADAEHLRGYGWADRDRHFVRLPIDRAMDLVAERGLPPVSPGITMEQMQRQRADPQVYGQSLRP